MLCFQSKGYHFNFQQDLSGNVEIICLSSNESISMPCDTLLDFVAELVKKSNKIKLDKMDTYEILGLDTK